MSVIDAHGHLGRWPAFAVTDGSARSLLAVMDRCGVTTACVSHLLAVGPDARAGNALLLAELARHPGRLLGYAVFNPHDPEAPERLRDLLEAPGVIGVKLHPEVHELPLDHAAYAPAFEIAAGRGRIVLAHSQYRSAWSDPARFAAVAPRYPELPLLMGHSGLWTDGFAPAAEAAARCPSIVLETCGSRMTARHLVRLVAEAGAERIAFGSDAVFLDLRVGLGRVLLAGLAAADRQQILHGTMNRLLQGLR
ncbi:MULTISPECIES: amidohydrolase family protein [unclassified Streptomyces]|uniref:amidohydrolase family protein n=1 Tax=unclassified Streptomyces TaxID=2593676 RepID=UPI0028C3AA3C|nr:MULTISPECIES: amidohydrolase family protein [unclassified Streptomyces]WNO72339.1 amidohydrolase family protein [Streptomyces sp. AM8-1-1]